MTGSDLQEGKSGGVRFIAVRRGLVARAEVRIRIPQPWQDGPAGRAEAAARMIAANTLLCDGGAHAVVGTLRSLGATCSVGADPDRIALGGGVLAENLAAYLGTIRSMLDAPMPCNDCVGHEKSRLASAAERLHAYPASRATRLLIDLLHGDSRYALTLPSRDIVEAVTNDSVAEARTQLRAPLVVVAGVVEPGATGDLVTSIFDSKTWDRATDGASTSPPCPDGIDGSGAPGRTQTVNAPGEATSGHVRIAWRTVGRAHRDAAAVHVAATALGSGETSRLWRRIRERGAATYTPRAVVEHAACASALVVVIDTAASSAEAVMEEVLAEVDDIGNGMESEELAAARLQTETNVRLSLSTQAGTATAFAEACWPGLDASWVLDYPRQVAAVGKDDVARVARSYLSRELAHRLVLYAARGKG